MCSSNNFHILSISDYLFRKAVVIDWNQEYLGWKIAHTTFLVYENLKMCKIRSAQSCNSEPWLNLFDLVEIIWVHAQGTYFPSNWWSFLIWLQALIAKGTYMDARDSVGYTALMHASRSCYYPMAQVIYHSKSNNKKSMIWCLLGF